MHAEVEESDASEEAQDAILSSEFVLNLIHKINPNTTIIIA